VKPYLSICALYRNEAPYLREWVEFHRLMGVERFFLYDNGSEDEHMAALGPYIDDDCVVLQEWPFFPGQITAYEDCIRRRREESRWIAFIDVDEFLFSPTGQPVARILTEFERWPGVGVNWAMYGTSGHRTPPPGLVIENYLWRSDEYHYNRPIKSIVDARRVAHFCTPHFFTYRDGWAVDEQFQRIEPRPYTDRVSFSRLRVNHYYTRSEDEYRVKNLVPRADTGRALEMPEGRLVRSLDRLAQVKDETILAHLPELRQALAEVKTRVGSGSG
jgi:hypothetical protein